MTIKVIDSCIRLTLECSKCGFDWDNMDFDATHVSIATREAEKEICPICWEEDENGS
jgi:hypothetical protein